MPSSRETASKPGFEVLHLQDIDPVPCPCGSTRRAFVDVSDSPASLHVVDIDREARTHYHKKLTEIYYILEGTGIMELDDQKIEVRPGSALLIRPGCRHRAVGNMKILNVPIPKFDPHDEWFD